MFKRILACVLAAAVGIIGLASYIPIKAKDGVTEEDFVEYENRVEKEVENEFFSLKAEVPESVDMSAHYEHDEIMGDLVVVDFSENIGETDFELEWKNSEDWKVCDQDERVFWEEKEDGKISFSSKDNVFVVVEG